MTTYAEADKAKPVIDALLGERLAACIQVMPITSHYIWKGDVQHEDEVLLLIKCKSIDYKRIEEMILSLHDYEVPEIVQIPILDGNDRYLDWLADPK